METPFSNLKSQLESAVRGRARDESEEDERQTFCATQLKLLDAQYRSMSEYKIIPSISTHNEFNEHEYRLTKCVLDYFSFISLLNQFGRVLSERYKIDVPHKKRIRFFRNKATEHWDEYAQYAHAGSITQQAGKPAIPLISSVYDPEERKNLGSKIGEILRTYNISFEIENPEVSNISSLEVNVEKMYSMLERIDPNLKKIPEDLIRLLFKFGFPTPISNVEEYSVELVEQLKHALGLQNPSLG